MKDLKSTGDEVLCSCFNLGFCKSFLNCLSSKVFCHRLDGFPPEGEQTDKNKVKLLFLSFIINDKQSCCVI